jgi:hypothetical protein
MHHQLRKYRRALVGLKVSRVWRGHGSAILLEFGALELHPLVRSRRRSYKGEITLMIEWSWRVESARKIIGGSWSDPSEWPALFRRIVGSRVTDIATFGRLPEITVTTSKGLFLSSFMTADGQPAWALLSRSPGLASLSVESGELVVGR